MLRNLPSSNWTSNLPAFEDRLMFNTSCFHRDVFFSDRRGLPIYRWITVKFNNLLRDGSRLTDKELTEGGKEEWNHSTELERTSLIIIRLVSPSSGDSNDEIADADHPLCLCQWSKSPRSKRSAVFNVSPINAESKTWFTLESQS